MDAQKVVLKLCVHDERDKQKAMAAVSSISGVQSLAMDMKEKKLTVIGNFDTIVIVRKLRKICRTDVLTVGPAKEQGKKEPAKEDAKKPCDKQIEECHKVFRDPCMRPYYFCHEENPNACAIC